MKNQYDVSKLNNSPGMLPSQSSKVYHMETETEDPLDPKPDNESQDDSPEDEIHSDSSEDLEDMEARVDKGLSPGQMVSLGLCKISSHPN